MRLEADSTARAPLLSNAAHFGLVIGASTAMRRLYPLATRVASTRVPVIIEGETGTGKEVLAESLHEVGGARGPFVVFDCTSDLRYRCERSGRYQRKTSPPIVKPRLTVVSSASTTKTARASTPTSNRRQRTGKPASDSM